MFRYSLIGVVFMTLSACSSSNQSLTADMAYTQTQIAKTMNVESMEAPSIEPVSKTATEESSSALLISQSSKKVWQKLGAYLEDKEIAILAHDRDLGVYFVRADAFKFSDQPLGTGLLQLKIEEIDEENSQILLLDITDVPFAAKQLPALSSEIELALNA